MSETGEPRVRRERPRACAYCNKSKTRCIWPASTDPGQKSCERCSRLKHICELPEFGDRRKRGSTTRVGQLEEKIDGLVTLLKASRQLPQASVGDLPAHSVSVLLGETTTVTPGLELPGIAAVPAAVKGPQPDDIVFTLPTPPVEQIDIFPSFQLSLGEAEDILQIYKESYSPLFPFVPVPQMTSANDLFTEKPFLFRTIMTVTAPQSAMTQKIADIWFRKYLAIALVMDLELNTPSRNAGRLRGGLAEDAAKAGGVYRGRAPHTLEDNRALLGCFYISSMVAALFRHSFYLPHTNYLTTACTILEGAQEYESDKFLVAQIRMQRLMVTGYHAFPNTDIEASAQADFGTALSMTMTSIRNEVEDLKKDLPPEIQNHYLFSLIYSGAIMRLYEPVIYMRTSLASNDVTDGARRTEGLWRCLEACRMFFNAYQAIPAAEVPYLPFSATCHLSFWIVTLSRLLFLSDSDWDLQLARKHVDLCDIVERLSEHFCEADRCAAADEWRRKRKFIDEGRSTMMVRSDKLRWIRSWYTSKLVPVEEHQPRIATTSASGAELPDVDMFEVDMLSPGQFDPCFWEALLNEDLAVGATNRG
ncbi:hypothetical protein CONLIGDRAFT_617558 [Coniochaeta ligniaria NRRL 30616]|uniref:Zn(2)-C6 fungal-type domain-containing protein n=1 Tax=Coniochaeta ligniaria NRRL 30616 TaxID=1408157 RepID=A0A1J7JH79_9PEZI|nr:hypothetical protein CONLIGDRAFT_617558 [Coniochaeta ligniaria NRRL 30616]